MALVNIVHSWCMIWFQMFTYILPWLCNPRKLFTVVATGQPDNDLPFALVNKNDG